MSTKPFNPHKFYRAVRQQRLDGNPGQPQCFQPERLKEAREARGMSKGDLRIASRGRPVGSYENGTIEPSDNDLLFVARALKMPIDFFTMPLDERIGFGEGTIFFRESKDCSCGVPDCPWWVVDGIEIQPCPFGGMRATCEQCDRPFTHLCDGPKRPDREGKDPRTCDARMCTRHRNRVGPSADLCDKCTRREKRRSRQTQ